MAGQDFAILDGVAVSAADMTVSIAIVNGPTFELTGFKELSSKNVVEKENQTAPDGTIVATSTGIPKPEAAGVMYRNGYQRMKRILMEYAPKRGGAKRVDLVPFTMTIIHDPPGSTEIYHRRIKGCKLHGSDVKNAVGPGVDEVPINLMPTGVFDVIDGEEVLA